jgi:hypothetical protein
LTGSLFDSDTSSILEAVNFTDCALGLCQPFSLLPYNND